jgi:hypothetical protein
MPFKMVYFPNESVCFIMLNQRRILLENQMGILKKELILNQKGRNNDINIILPRMFWSP